MTATHTSKRESNTTLNSTSLTAQLFKKGAGDEINTSNKCPAIIFAAKRIARVKGRIIVLIISIKTIKGIRDFGVPLGTR